MKLTDLTRTYVKEISSPVTFEIGEGYCENRRVMDLEYNEDAATITADVANITIDVSGTYSNNCVKIVEQDGEIEADCDCSSGARPCKHIIAVMLEFVENNHRYVKKAEMGKEPIDSPKVKGGKLSDAGMEADEKQIDSLKAAAAKLSNEELMEMVIGCAQKYPDFKRELMERFPEEKQEEKQDDRQEDGQQSKQETIDAIRKQIEKAFPNQRGAHSPSQIARKLKNIVRSKFNVPNDMKVEIYWAIADRILEEPNEYEVDSKALTDIATDYMGNVASLLKGKDELNQRRRQILKRLMEHYERDNCRIGDIIYKTAHDLLSDRSDYQIIIDCMERIAESPSRPSQNHVLLAHLYKEIGDDGARLMVLESSLRDVMDYWRLAQYWIEKDQNDKALEVMKEGIEKGEGNKEKLYLYMQAHYEARGDYDAILKLLELKIQRSQYSYYGLENDETYKYLMNHYKSTDNYKGEVELLNLRLASDSRIDFRFYKEARDMLQGSDWSNFEKLFVDRIKKRGILS